MAKILHPTAYELENIMQDNSIVVVDFWADWCGPCKMLAPVFEQLADEYSGDIKFVKINVDEESDLASKCGVMSIPTVIFYKNGIEENREIGFKPLDFYKAILDSLC
ncbi:MAG: thioredoxin [Acutalibacteraceae bacterium]